MEPICEGEKPWKRQAQNFNLKILTYLNVLKFVVTHATTHTLWLILSLGPSQQLRVWRMFSNPRANGLWNVTVLWKVSCENCSLILAFVYTKNLHCSLNIWNSWKYTYSISWQELDKKNK